MWILIIVTLISSFGTGAAAIEAIPFSTQASCQAAETLLHQKLYEEMKLPFLFFCVQQ